MIQKDVLENAIINAQNWLQNIATVKDNKPIGNRHDKEMAYTFWNGALRGEYHVASKKWGYLCPIWHTGQAVKAMIMAADVLKDPALVDAACFNAEFIMRNRITEGADKGLILAFEDHADIVNTSAVLESLDGLFTLSQKTGNSVYQTAALDALYWVANNAWDPKEKIFKDLYNPESKQFVFGVRGAQGRPLLDDAVFIKGWELTRNEQFKSIAIETAETLLKDEFPAGNWLKYIPCNAQKGNIHPRHAFWWGMPMLDVYKLTNDSRFLDCFQRSVDWYQNALREDGGFFRGTYTDFNTDSFGHATSGSACAVISLLTYYNHTKDKKVVGAIEKGLNFCLNMQLTNPQDPNLNGAILEKVLQPDGTDHSPYHIRDLGTIFFIQAAAAYLNSDLKC